MDDVLIERTTEALWVNDAVGCIGRFTSREAVVLPSGERQLEGEPFLERFHGLGRGESWERFTAAMRAHHGVDLSGEPVPGRA